MECYADNECLHILYNIKKRIGWLHHYLDSVFPYTSSSRQISPCKMDFWCQDINNNKNLNKKKSETEAQKKIFKFYYSMLRNCKTNLKKAKWKITHISRKYKYSKINIIIIMVIILTLCLVFSCLSSARISGNIQLSSVVW